MRVYKIEGIILKRIRFGEADLLLTVFTPHHGKCRLLAKGARKITSKKGGSLELFNLIKANVAKGRNLDLITEVEAIETFKIWKKNLKKVARAYQFCEIVDKLSAEGAPSQVTFELLKNILGSLCSEESEESLKVFQTRLLEELGFWPRDRKNENFNPEVYIEDLIEKKLKSREFMRQINNLQK